MLKKKKKLRLQNQTEAVNLYQMNRAFDILPEKKNTYSQSKLL